MRLFSRNLPMLLAPALLLVAGCGSGLVNANSSNSAFSVTPSVAAIDTNCASCNSANAQGSSVHQFTAKLPNGRPAEVAWSVSGGDVATVLTVTPGFLQPLTPENAALSANGSIAITGFLAEAGGTTGINFELANSANGQSGGQGSLSAASCQRDNKAFTSCTVTYTAPASVQTTGATYVVATVSGASSKATSVVLVNTAGVTSNPATHQAQFPATLSLGSSGGNNKDYDTRGGQIVDCCSASTC
jgi:hypothetical protein